MINDSVHNQGQFVESISNAVQHEKTSIIDECIEKYN